jgi:hypothetical protein
VSSLDDESSPQFELVEEPDEDEESDEDEDEDEEESDDWNDGKK